MARNFISAIGAATAAEYLSLATAVLTSVPFTMSCWFNQFSTVDADVLMQVGVIGADNNKFQMLVNAGILTGVTRSSSSASVVSTTNSIAHVWNHGCFVSASAASRAIYLNYGRPTGSKGTNTTSKTPSGINGTIIGAEHQPVAPDFPMHGMIAEAAIWNIDLNDGEVLSLARGIRPSRIRPMNLVAYWPIYGTFSPEIDVMHSGKNLLINTSTLPAPHPPIPFYRSTTKRKKFFVSSSAFTPISATIFDQVYP